MPRYAPELECSVEDKSNLLALAKSRTAEAHAVERARIILACLEGKEIQQVARELAVSLATVSKWRQRYSLWGLRGLRDQPRPGKPVRYDAAFRKRVLATLEEPPPPGMSHWDGPAVAERLDASVHAVWRVLRREGIKSDSGEVEGKLRKAIREGARTIEQDIPIWENKRYRERPLLSDADGPIMQFRRWYHQFYAAEPAVSAPAEPHNAPLSASKRAVGSAN